MQELYKEVLIPNFKEIQQELLDSITEDWNNGTTFAFNYTVKEINEKCPKFMAWMNSINKAPFRLLRFYVTRPGGRLHEHIDGGLPITSPFGLNIPVYGCEGTTMTWYDCAPENMSGGKDDGYFVAIYPKDYTKLTPIESLEITRPHFVRNDIMHSVDNNKDTPRIMFTVRWPLHTKMFRDLDQVVKTDGLFA